jgi:hypothetical protein
VASPTNLEIRPCSAHTPLYRTAPAPLKALEAFVAHTEKTLGRRITQAWKVTENAEAAIRAIKGETI